MREKGKSLFACGKYDEAIILLKSYVSRTDVLDRLEVAKLSGLLGAVYLAKGKMKRALTPCLEALFIHEQRFGKDHIDCAGFVCLLGSIFHRRGRYRKAIQQYERVLEIVQKTYRDKNHIKAVDALQRNGPIPSTSRAM